MRLRTVRRVLTLTLGCLLVPLGAEAQPAGKVTRIGFLSPTSPAEISHLVDAFLQGLRDLGWVEGRNIRVEYRWAHGGVERLPDLAADLARLKVDVILAYTSPAIAAAKRATKSVPIVMVAVGDPVASGFVASLPRPGGNITGVSNISRDLSGKVLQLLKEVVPGATYVAVLRNPDNPVSVLQLKETENAARLLGIQLEVVEARNPNQLEEAFEVIAKKRAAAVIALGDPVVLGQRKRVAELALKARLPSAFARSENVQAGGLISYGPNLAEQFRRTALYVDKILKSAHPRDLPVEEPTKLELVINLKTGKTLGLTIPPSVLIRADEVIQ